MQEERRQEDSNLIYWMKFLFHEKLASKLLSLTMLLLMRHETFGPNHKVCID